VKKGANLIFQRRHRRPVPFSLTAEANAAIQKRTAHGGLAMRGLSAIRGPLRAAPFSPQLARRQLAMGSSFYREPLLYTPGPLTTSLKVKQSMLRDIGSRDPDMIRIVQEIRDGLLELGGVSQEAGWECVLMQGSGTFAVEGIVSSVVPPPEAGGRILVVSNGAYGKRMADMCRIHGIDHVMIHYSETEAPSAADVVSALERHGGNFTHVGIIHHETTAGTLNPVEEIGAAIRDYDPSISYIVDSMSGFGAYPVDLEAGNVSYIVSSANKNIEGVPGFAFGLCRKDKLVSEGDNARTLALDMKANWAGLENGGQFRFTPPTHALMAFHTGTCPGAAIAAMRNKTREKSAPERKPLVLPRWETTICC
jgi:2-aminoethylphosphonate-pyruvate transaminase